MCSSDLMIRRPPRSTQGVTSFPTRRSSDLLAFGRVLPIFLGSRLTCRQHSRLQGVRALGEGPRVQHDDSNIFAALECRDGRAHATSPSYGPSVRRFAHQRLAEGMMYPATSRGYELAHTRALVAGQFRTIQVESEIRRHGGSYPGLSLSRRCQGRKSRKNDSRSIG